MNPCICILSANTLTSMSLRGILWDMSPMVEILTFPSMEAFLADCNHYFVHFFISDSIIISNANEFDALKKETTVLCEGSGAAFTESGFYVIDISLPEKEIVADIIRRLENEQPYAARNAQQASNPLDALSEREKDVLALIVKGYMNKEIADKLSISTATAIFHRNNICHKLDTRSIGRLTVMAVLSGLVKINDI